MGTVIEACAAAAAQERSLNPGSALELADAASGLCLERADRASDELDVLINAGVFHDKILSEPAFASLIQEDIGANVQQRPGAEHGTFSFDLYNGGCGMLSAVHLIDGMLASGTVSLGMVVASDMDPEPGISEGFTFPSVGGALLLSADDSRAGFTAFRFATFPEFAESFRSYVDWHQDPLDAGAGHGANVLTVEISDAYAVQALDCAEATVRELASTPQLDLSEVDLLVATASIPGFGELLAQRLGVPAAGVASPPEALASAHTAATAVALDSAILTPAQTVLFVSAGAGITIAVALYRG